MSSRVVLQKAVLPAREQSWLELGDDALSGFVVNAADVSWADTTAKVHDAMGLGFPGSPLSPDDAFVDVLRFDVAPFMKLINAVGRTEQSPDGFIDRPPFNGTGFVSAKLEKHFIPLWWLEPTRIPAGAELWRIHADGRQEPIALYPHVALGWNSVPTEENPEMQPFGNQMPPSDLMGSFIKHPERMLPAQTIDNGRVIVGDLAQSEGLKLSHTGRWFEIFEAEEAPEVFGLRVTARLNGLDFIATRRLPSGTGTGTVNVRLVYAGRNADEAEAAGLQKTDAAVYETTASWDDLEDVQMYRLESKS